MSRLALLFGVLCLPSGLIAAEPLDKELGFVSAEKSKLGENTVETGKIGALPALRLYHPGSDNLDLFVLRTDKKAKDRKEAQEVCSKLGKGNQWRLPGIVDLLLSLEASGGKTAYLPDVFTVTNDGKAAVQIVAWLDFDKPGPAPEGLKEDTLLAFSGLKDMQPIGRADAVQVIEQGLGEVQKAEASDFRDQMDQALNSARNSREGLADYYASAIDEAQGTAQKKQIQDERDKVLKQLDDRIEKLEKRDAAVLAEFKKQAQTQQKEMKAAIDLFKNGPTVLCVAGKIELEK